MSDFTAGRYRPIPGVEPTAEQTEVLRKVAENRSGRVPLPFRIWSSSPELAYALEPLASYLVPGSRLSPRETELAILTSAAYWDCAYVWDGHARAARALGLAERAIEAIRAGERPELDTGREQAIWQAATELQSSRSLSRNSFEEVIREIGRDGLADLTALLGFYASVAFVLIAYDVPGRPDG